MSNVKIFKYGYIYYSNKQTYKEYIKYIKKKKLLLFRILIIVWAFDCHIIFINILDRYYKY